jgi:hypothetical protein
LNFRKRLTEKWSFREKGWKLPHFNRKLLGMLLKAVGQLLGTSKRVKESCWEMPNGYLKASGQFLKCIGKPLENAQIPAFSQ